MISYHAAIFEGGERLLAGAKYISDLVGEQYKDWLNELVLFDAGTGTGKTTFILFVLAAYAKALGKRILFLCNRTKLRLEVERQVKLHNMEHVRVMSYQRLEAEIKSHEEPTGYDYIVFDEIHYLTSDAEFNEYTDLTYNYLMKQEGNVCILMSATAKSFFNMLIEKGRVNPKHHYVIEKDYGYVNYVYFYKKELLTSIIDRIRATKPNEKLVVFCNSADRMLEMHGFYRDEADFFCSEHSRNLDLIAICNPNCIIKYARNLISFEKPILFTTKALDNGVDLKDPAIKHIFTEIFDLDSMVQSLGRKRSQNAAQERCNFYIKHYMKQSLQGQKNLTEQQLSPARMFREDPAKFYETFGEGKKRATIRHCRIFYGHFAETGSDMRINEMMYSKYVMREYEIAAMMESGYLSVVKKWLGPELSSKILMIDLAPDARDAFAEYMERIKGQRLYKDAQQELKNQFVKLGLQDRTMGINVLNGKLMDAGYSYSIASARDKRRVVEKSGKTNPNYGKTYWTVT